jgi:hypothetical protein
MLPVFCLIELPAFQPLHQNYNSAHRPLNDRQLRSGTDSALQLQALHQGIYKLKRSEG